MGAFRKNVLSTFFIYLLFVGCNGKKENKYPALTGYDLDKPSHVKLKDELDEISGIFYYPKDTSVFAINDEAGYLYKIYLRDKVEIARWRFSDGADYEDICLVDSTFYALHSNADLTIFKITSPETVDAVEVKSPFSGKNDFETLYYDATLDKLILICKDCKQDDNGSVSAFSFDRETKNYSSTPAYQIKAEEVLQNTEPKEKKFKASAAAIHPITKELYVISSVNKALVVAETTGKIKKIIPLDPKLFKQPEGITFSPEGHLLISNEHAEVGAANILVFKPKGTFNAKEED